MTDPQKTNQDTLLAEARAMEYVFDVNPKEATISDLIEVKKVTEMYGQALQHKSYDITQLRVAIMTELGEVLQAAKSDWAWWKKVGDASAIDLPDLTEEISDVMHFFFLGVYIQSYDNASVLAQRAIAPAATFTGSPYVLFMNIARMQFSTPGSFLACIFAFSDHHGISRESVVEAYYAKAEKNIERWLQVLNL